MLVSGFMHSQDHGYSGSALRQGHTVAAQRRIHTGLPPRSGYLPSQWGECTWRNRFGKGRDLFGGAATPSSDVVVLIVQDSDCLRLPAHSRMLSTV